MELQDKCVKCGEPLIVRIYKNRAGGKQQGLYCGSCGKYHKFLTNEEVYYAFYKKYKIVNEFGDLSNTKLKQLKLPQADEIFENLGYEKKEIRYGFKFYSDDKEINFFNNKKKEIWIDDFHVITVIPVQELQAIYLKCKEIQWI